MRERLGGILKVTLLCLSFGQKGLHIQVQIVDFLRDCGDRLVCTYNGTLLREEGKF